MSRRLDSRSVTSPEPKNAERIRFFGQHAWHAVSKAQSGQSYLWCMASMHGTLCPRHRVDSPLYGQHAWHAVCKAQSGQPALWCMASMHGTLCARHRADSPLYGEWPACMSRCDQGTERTVRSIVHGVTKARCDQGTERTVRSMASMHGTLCRRHRADSPLFGQHAWHAVTKA